MTKIFNCSFHLYLLYFLINRKIKKIEMKKTMYKRQFYDLFNSFDFFTFGCFLSNFGFVSLYDL